MRAQVACDHSPKGNSTLFTYAIRPHSAPHKSATGPEYLKRENILARQVARCTHKVGDDVHVQTSKGKRWGIVDELIVDHTQCEWHNGSQPFFISVRCPVKTQGGINAIYMSEIVKAPLKKVKA